MFFNEAEYYARLFCALQLGPDGECWVTIIVYSYYLASAWNLPKDTCQLILRHHDHHFFSSCQDETLRMTMATLKMAENFVHLQRRFSPSQDWQYFEASALVVLDLENDDYLDIKDDVEEYFIDKQL
ncbi:hypothetical protein [Pseudoalteromonas ruthenica]|uniref:hypothetical protein n=1 Tax=Pseudoalteromonas ruthenica TaxID=151081 RepID=UPI00110A5B28|nr:hypothetical protein [Pseudoalteromonas ruthenica]TMO48029.1 hypothetical protein CWC24_05745 [Pseudoalteromonas ruthenica]TMO49762.1 hypothetical protein CWC23_14240 [Pseudoalteromonas ruthenica]